MKNEELFNQIRNRNLSTEDFRKNADLLSLFLAEKTQVKIPEKDRVKVVLILVLRSSVAMLPAFLKYFPDSPVGFIGLKRNEETAIAEKYYENLPELNKDSVIVIPDPMLATGGSLKQSIEILANKGVLAENIYYTGFIGATVGVDIVSKIIPKENITLFAVDPELDNRKFIVPGLGDFGDRYFKTSKA